MERRLINEEPVIKLSNEFNAARKCIKQTNEMCEQGFPCAQLAFVHEIDDQHTESIESQRTKLFYEHVLVQNQLLIDTIHSEALTVVGTHDPSPRIVCTFVPLTVCPRP